LASFVASCVLLAFSFGGILHATISHDHTAQSDAHEHSYGPPHERYGQDRQESIVWQSLHAAVRHEDNSAFSLLAAALILTIIRGAVVSLRVRLPMELIEVIGYHLGAWLVRGIAPYRRFS
jgi:hypothetical protein